MTSRCPRLTILALAVLTVVSIAQTFTLLSLTHRLTIARVELEAAEAGWADDQLMTLKALRTLKVCTGRLEVAVGMLGERQSGLRASQP